ncbi:LANO_0A05226g1_1 [Lachancea nothofagi CBS 11611]|uniref:LANO_0A05226g1_1 n=1 Tax=Lachancea nothofagi CBS 11611 TaxID=1266666 RepID=A0A1G4IRA0_9SACH|nr:LANO_0A05226g1_1 [Lachancea nothofagi CBS 11611]
MVRKLEWKEVGATGHALLSPGYITAKDSELLFTSGCVGNDPKSGEYPEDVESQARNAMLNLKNVLAAASTDFDHVLKVLLFVADGSYAAGVNKVYQEFFPSAPARSCVVVSFPDSRLKVELECVAEIPSGN